MQGGEHDRTASAIRAGDLDAAPLTPAERLLLDYCGTVALHAHRVSDRQVQELREAGWTDEQIAEATYQTALFSLFVRLADAFDIHPDAAIQEPEGTPRVLLQP